LTYVAAEQKAKGKCHADYQKVDRKNYVQNIEKSSWMLLVFASPPINRL
jgi:hypothetical protein